jgi:hypothetical protein
MRRLRCFSEGLIIEVVDYANRFYVMGRRHKEQRLSREMDFRCLALAVTIPGASCGAAGRSHCATAHPQSASPQSAEDRRSLPVELKVTSHAHGKTIQLMRAL